MAVVGEAESPQSPALELGVHLDLLPYLLSPVNEGFLPHIGLALVPLTVTQPADESEVGRDRIPPSYTGRSGGATKCDRQRQRLLFPFGGPNRNSLVVISEVAMPRQAIFLQTSAFPR